LRCLSWYRLILKIYRITRTLFENDLLYRYVPFTFWVLVLDTELPATAKNKGKYFYHVSESKVSELEICSTNYLCICASWRSINKQKGGKKRYFVIMRQRIWAKYALLRVENPFLRKISSTLLINKCIVFCSYNV